MLHLKQKREIKITVYVSNGPYVIEGRIATSCKGLGCSVVLSDIIRAYKETFDYKL